MGDSPLRPTPLLGLMAWGILSGKEFTITTTEESDTKSSSDREGSDGEGTDSSDVELSGTRSESESELGQDREGTDDTDGDDLLEIDVSRED